MALGRKTGGRKKGTPNKATAEIKAAAQLHGPAAIAELAKLMRKHRSGMVRVAAAREILDRGYGKATQPLSSDPESPLIVEIARFADSHSSQLGTP